MRLRAGVWALVVGACAAAVLHAPAAAQSPMEQQVFAALNLARTDPAGYSRLLQTYRGYFHANFVSLPGASEDLETTEGVAVVDEAISFLGGQHALPSLVEAPVLHQSAADHAEDQAATGATGHVGSDGSTPGKRVRRHGGGEFIAEVIAYGPEDAVDAVRQLVVDDGVADRGHRGVIYSPELRYVGIACGTHPEFRTMCVIDMAVTRDGSFSRQIHLATRMGGLRLFGGY